MYEQVDYHIHTLYLKCANETMTVPALVAKAEELGLKSIAVTDHLNAPQFLDEHRHIKRDLAEIDSELEIIFGVEVNVIDQDTGEVSINQQQIDELGFELVIVDEDPIDLLVVGAIGHRVNSRQGVNTVGSVKVPGHELRPLVGHIGELWRGRDLLVGDRGDVEHRALHVIDLLGSLPG